MAVSKRLRMEILRRDSYTCRYCGGSAPDVKLTIDHVTPLALGGADEPGNLATACADCNAGKSSMPADASLVADVSEDALRWSRAMAEASRLSEIHMDLVDSTRENLDTLWRAQMTDWRGAPRPRPAGWEHDIEAFLKAGLSPRDLLSALDATTSKAQIINGQTGAHWRYFCGVCWRKLDKLQETARALLVVKETDGVE